MHKIHVWLFAVVLLHASASALRIGGGAPTFRAESSSTRASPRMAAPRSLEAMPCIIVPGFGNADIDYKEPLGQDASAGFVAALQRRGFDDVRVLPLERYEWAKTILGLIGTIIWKPWATPDGPAYSWFVERLRAEIEEAHAQSSGGSDGDGDGRVLLVAHSAGGWLARAALGDGSWPDGKRASDYVCGLVTLGAPHYAPAEGTPDVTQGVLQYVNDNYPGAFLKADGIAYVTVGGDAIVGNPDKPTAEAVAAGSEAERLYALRGEGSAARAAYQSYLMTCGRGDVTGDGVVPLSYTQLDGAEQIVLEGVLHSINEAGTTLPTERWYGSEGVLDRWLPQVRRAVSSSSGGAIGGGLMMGGGGSLISGLTSPTDGLVKAVEEAGQRLRAFISTELGAPTNLLK